MGFANHVSIEEKDRITFLVWWTKRTKNVTHPFFFPFFQFPDGSSSSPLEKCLCSEVALTRHDDEGDADDDDDGDTRKK